MQIILFDFDIIITNNCEWTLDDTISIGMGNKHWRNIIVIVAINQLDINQYL